MLFFTSKIFKIFAILIAVSFLTPAITDLSAAQTMQTETFFNRQYYNLRTIARYYGFRLSFRSNRVYMTGKFHNFTFTPEKMAASFNGVQMTLSHAVYSKNGSCYISKIDYDTILMPLIDRTNMKRHKVQTVFIDPGHGGKDVGAEGIYYSEKNLTLRLASKVRTLLRKANFNVIMSRRSDTYLTLKERADLANKSNADIFVSIHFNSAANKKVYGLESYCMTPVGASSSNSSKIEWQKHNGNLHDRNNFALAYLMQRSMLGHSKALDRGVKHARFLVLREVKMPAVLVECGFLSNPDSERIIGTDLYLNQIAKGIAYSIINYKKVAENATLKK